MTRASYTCLFALTTAMATAPGCGGFEEPLGEGSIAQQEMAIVNGTPDAQHQAVGRLLASSARGTLECTATLISPRVVVTAGHCLYGAESAVIEFDHGSYGATQLTVHPDYDPEEFHANDIGLVLLDGSVPLEPVALARKRPEPGEWVKLVGFGASSSAKDDGGDRRLAANQITSVTNHSFAYATAGGHKGNTCHGDSGGPTFRVKDDGQEVLLGVHSAGTRVCGEIGVDMAVDWFFDWVDAQLGETALQAEPYGPHVVGVACSLTRRRSPVPWSLVLVLLGLVTSRTRRRPRDHG